MKNLRAAQQLREEWSELGKAAGGASAIAIFILIIVWLTIGTVIDAFYTSSGSTNWGAGRPDTPQFIRVIQCAVLFIAVVAIIVGFTRREWLERRDIIRELIAKAGNRGQMSIVTGGIQGAATASLYCFFFSIGAAAIGIFYATVLVGAIVAGGLMLLVL